MFKLRHFVLVASVLGVSLSGNVFAEETAVQDVKPTVEATAQATDATKEITCDKAKKAKKHVKKLSKKDVKVTKEAKEAKETVQEEVPATTLQK